MSASSTPSSARGRRSLQPWLEEARVWAEELLGAALPSPAEVPPRLREALEYALLGGGKRLRPALVRLSCEWFGGDHERAAAPATAVELIHTYSLVHDDLPCMDDDALRRGRPTCHTVYGEAMGTLVGDALQTLAFEVLARSGSRHAAEWAACLARAAGAAGMVGGQVLDMEAEALIEGDPQAGLRRMTEPVGHGGEVGVGRRVDAEDSRHVLGTGRVDLEDRAVGQRRPHEVDVGHAVDRHVVEIGVGTGQQGGVFSPKHGVAQDRTFGLGRHGVPFVAAQRYIGDRSAGESALTCSARGPLHFVTQNEMP